jgi:GDP-L-fucose synthase
MVLAAERYDGPEPVNVGSGEEIAIRDLVRLIADACEYRGKIAWDTTQPNGQPRRRLDTSRAEKYFGFKAKMPLKKGIAETVSWYRNQMVAAHAH